MTISEQHVELLRSHDPAVQAAAMQKMITLASLHPGKIDMRPAVPALLDIYADDMNDQQLRIMAVAALRAAGDKYGMDQLYLLSEREDRWSRVHQFAQNAVNHYYTQKAMEHEEARSAYFMAKGDLEKAEKHTARAAVYRGRLG